MAEFAPVVIPPPPPPPSHWQRSYGRRRRGGIIVYIILAIVTVGIMTTFSVISFRGFKRHGFAQSGRAEFMKTTSHQLHETADIFPGIDVVPTPPSSGSTRLLEQNMTTQSRVRRNH
ncbi:hypothetical protein FGADI_7897 [Fusarium gaditjirri]|uniref:Uncharacterized protein n=1 Tax=Fusarium gaditjirri TaxID=282569 RepID=A0A8H4T3T2_9HYPO|nr:hypothetical protein FGADI_7897 [Fusarium gaditjirri]